MAGCNECGLPGYSDPKQCPVCNPSDRIRVRIKSVSGYAVLSKELFEGLSGPNIKVVQLWHNGNAGMPEQAAKVNLNQMRQLNDKSYRTFAIALVSMPPEEEWR